MDLIFGNLSSLVAAIWDMLSSSRKKPRDILLLQSVGQFFYGLTGIILKGYSATVQNAICIIRNLATAYRFNSKLLEWALVIIGVVLGLVCNNLAFIGLLPILANLEYTLIMFRFPNNTVILKSAFAVNVLLYTIFNFAISNYVGAIADAVLVIVTLAFVIRNRHSQEKTDP